MEKISLKTKLYRKNWHRKNYQERLLQNFSKDDLVQCKICGKYFRQVGSHIVQRHGMLAREYRKEFGFDVKKGQLSKDLKELYSKQVFENGTVNNLKSGAKYRFKKKQVGLGKYMRSEQTKKRLKVLHKFNKKFINK